MDKPKNGQEAQVMEKILWVRSTESRRGDQDGLDEVNRYLQEGWRVKLLSASPMGDSVLCGQAYIVIEKDGEQV